MSIYKSHLVAEFWDTDEPFIMTCLAEEFSVCSMMWQPRWDEGRVINGLKKLRPSSLYWISVSVCRMDKHDQSDCHDWWKSILLFDDLANPSPSRVGYQLVWVIRKRNRYRAPLGGRSASPCGSDCVINDGRIAIEPIPVACWFIDFKTNLRTFI